MTSMRLLTTISRVLIAFVAALILVPGSWAITSGQEYKFKGAPDGAQAMGGLVSDGAGNFYGTTNEGGRNSVGAVFELSPAQGGHWTEVVIYSFTGGADGKYPQGNLAIGADSSLYGTAVSGGLRPGGTVFKLTPGQNGSWTETTLYNFQDGSDGAGPSSGVTFDVEGNLYGTTSTGGVCNTYCGGTVFKLTPGQGDNWTETTLYDFQAGTDGWSPSGVVLDALGNLYGATVKGGNIQGGQCGDQGCGTVFELTPSDAGSWTKSTLYVFNYGLDGGYPSSGVTFDSSGNLYGETYYGGSFACPGSGCGVVFELSPVGGSWKFGIAHTFNGLNGSRGRSPSGGLVLDGAGNLYGTTESGGDLANCGGYGCGTIFKLSPKTGGGFAFSAIGAFNNTDGAYPTAGVIVDAAGNLYGTTNEGGDLSCNAPYGCGVVFEITP
jgi:uncharacterized repeat protein (TIGR03803 family)